MSKFKNLEGQTFEGDYVWNIIYMEKREYYKKKRAV